jgi:hypothetical protein
MKKERKKEKRRVAWTFRSFELPEKLFCQIIHKNCFCSSSESASQVKPRLNLFWLKPKVYQTGPKHICKFMDNLFATLLDPGDQNV